jgi:endonuclease/exonuclease/phosphatase family metal-dependent hydrolase
MRRGARELARAIGGDYAYAVEFVELDIGREVHGDTGQAIVSRRPLRDVAVACHSSQNDWFADDREPRLGQRVRLAGDVPLGDTFMRVHAIHLESSDVLGEKRVIQSREVLDRAQREACDRPQVIAGDFNAWYCSAPELEVMRRAGFVDAARTVGDAAATHDNGLRLDMVWTRGTRVIEAGVVRGLGLSDHAPVWAVLEPE